MVQYIWAYDYNSCLQVINQMVSGGSFALLAEFLPGVKVLIQVAGQLHVYVERPQWTITNWLWWIFIYLIWCHDKKYILDIKEYWLWRFHKAFTFLKIRYVHLHCFEQYCEISSFSWFVTISHKLVEYSQTWKKKEVTYYFEFFNTFLILTFHVHRPFRLHF